MEIQTEEKTKLIEEIAQKLGITVEQLIDSGKDVDKIIEEYQAGNFRILNE